MKTCPCPHCHKPINAASLLGSMNAGKPRKVSAEERERRSARMRQINADKAK
jgi:hypothetical protein